MKKAQQIFAMIIVCVMVAGCSTTPKIDRGEIPNADQPINPGLTNEFPRPNIDE